MAVYDTSPTEVGHLLVELSSGRFTGTSFAGTSFDVVTAAESREPVRTMGGLSLVPDILLVDLEPVDSDLLVPPCSEMCDVGGGEPFAGAAERFLAAGVPVAAICGATAGLRSAPPEYLAISGYADGDRYLNERAVVDGGLITATPNFRCSSRALGVADERTLGAYERLFYCGFPDPDGGAEPQLRRPEDVRSCN